MPTITRAGNPNNTRIADYKTYANTVLCGTLPSTIVNDIWYTLECSVPNATYVKVENNSDQLAISFSAIKVWGIPSNPPTAFVAPGTGVALAVG